MDNKREKIELRDAFDKVIYPGCKVDVQLAGEHTVYEWEGELLFAPYGKLERVRDYFRQDIILIEE